MEIFGEPEKDGKLVPDDVSGYKFISLRVFAKGAQYIRLELITRGQGTNLESGYPMASFRVSPGFNSYKLKLDSFSQPAWAMQLDLKGDVLKKLTRSEEHTSELQSHSDLVCRLLLEKK